MNFLASLFHKPEPAPVRYVIATREESAKVRTAKVGKRLELEMLRLHTPPEQYRAAIDRAKCRASERMGRGEK